LKKTINHDSSIKMGSNNIFGGDSAIGENAKIIKNQNINVNSVTYDIDKEDVAFVEKASMLILNKYGDNKITWGGAISLIAGLITIFDGFGSILDRSNGFSWMPGWIPTAPREFGNYVIIIGFILFLVLLTGCGPIITKGHIVDKKFTAAHTTTVDVQVDDISIPITTYHPDSWDITFENSTENGKLRRTIDVSKEIYDRHKIGDWYDLEKKN